MVSCENPTGLLCAMLMSNSGQWSVQSTRRGSIIVSCLTSVRLYMSCLLSACLRGHSYLCSSFERDKQNKTERTGRWNSLRILCNVSHWHFNLGNKIVLCWHWCNFGKADKTLIAFIYRQGAIFQGNLLYQYHWVTPLFSIHLNNSNYNESPMHLKYQ